MRNLLDALLLALIGLLTLGFSSLGAQSVDREARQGAAPDAPVLAPAAPLRVGRAAVKITPPVGGIMGNSYGTTVSEGVHDDLYAKALVLEQGGFSAALVACDLVSLRRPLVEETRKLIEAATGIPGERVIITATHAHAGPQMHPLFWDAVGGAPKQRSEEYVRALPALIAESVRLAQADLQPARVSVARVGEQAISFNRRYLMKDGTVKMNPGALNPEVVRPVGPIDPDLSVIFFESVEGAKPLATLVNFALHVAVVGGNRISADFPAVLSARLAEVEGAGMLTIFTTGMSGNINNIDVSHRRRLDSRAEAVRIGTILAADVLRAFPSLRPIAPGPLRARSQAVALPVPEVTPAEVEWARSVMARNGRPDSPPLFDLVKAWRILDLAELRSAPLRTEVQAITLGDELALVGFPGDAFVELGLMIKQNSPFPFTVVSEQAGNGAISYVPNRKAFDEGSYEVISARFSPGGGELLADAVLRLLIDLFPRER